MNKNFWPPRKSRCDGARFTSQSDTEVLPEEPDFDDGDTIANALDTDDIEVIERAVRRLVQRAARSGTAS